ncbi:MAG: SDR family NAD(P)-dependent oxidoreductase [Steroidobacteraceae bacterium]
MNQDAYQPFSIVDKVVLVTGASGGIGLGIAERMAQVGARVIGLASTPGRADQLARRLPYIRVLSADLGAKDGPAAIFEQAHRMYERVDVLVNNAALFPSLPFLHADADDYDRLFNVNLRGLALLSRAFAMACIADKRPGKIINVSSMETVVAALPEGLAPYSASKGGVNSLTHTLARELGPHRISVNAIAPGGIVHDELVERSRSLGEEAFASVQAGLEQIKRRTNVGRLGNPDDIASVAIFLASAASDYISGQVIVVDGGTTKSLG